MENKSIVKKYIEINNLDNRPIRDRFLMINDLLMYLIDNGVNKKEINEDLMGFIIDQLSSSYKDPNDPDALDIYLAYYLVYYKNRIKQVNKLPETSGSNLNKENSEIIMDYETIDVSPDDIPEKEYDMEYIKELGIVGDLE